MGKAVQNLVQRLQTPEELQQELDGLTTDGLEARVVSRLYLSRTASKDLVASVWSLGCQIPLL